MWLDPLVERKYLKNINVTTNAVNIRLELLKGKRATENKQVGKYCTGSLRMKKFKGVLEAFRCSKVQLMSSAKCSKQDFLLFSVLLGKNNFLREGVHYLKEPFHGHAS